MINEESIEAILRPLIEVDTSNPPGKNYVNIVKIIRDQLAYTDCEVKLVKPSVKRVKELRKENSEISDDRVNLIASLDRGQGKTVILNGHTDVVPAIGHWTYPPFKLSKKSGEWYGRGVADMKGPLAVLILVFIEMAMNKNWRGKLVLTATVDEEIGGYTGLSYLMDEGLVKGDYCIVGDGDVSNITNASNGCLRFIVTLKGKAVHASRNWTGVNAIEKAARLIVKLERYNSSLLKKKSKIATSSDYGVDKLTPSLTVGLIKGGTKVNIVPDQCVIEVDRRVIPEESKNQAIEEFKKILKDFEKEDDDFKYNLLVERLHDTFYTSRDNEVIKALSTSYEEVKGERCEILGGLGCYDAAHVAKNGIPVAVLGVARPESNIHGLNEKAKISDLADFGNIIKNTVIKLMK